MKISARLRLFVLFVTLLSCSTIGGIVYFRLAHLAQTQKLEDLQSRAQSKKLHLAGALRQLEADAALLAELPALDRFLNQPAQARNLERQEVEETFRRFMLSRPDYDQVRFIGALNGGLELVRVDRKDGAVVVIPPENHQQKADRDYFRTAAKLPNRSIYIHDPTLNRERGRIEVPHKPMLRVTTTRREESGALQGVVVINLRLQQLLDRVFANNDASCCEYLLNQRGDYLLHPNTAMTYGFDLGKRHLAQQQSPGLGAWLTMSNASPEFVSSWQDESIAWSRLPLDPSGSRFLVIGQSDTRNSTSSRTLQIGMEAVMSAGGLAVLVLALGYWFSKRMVGDLTSLTQTASRIAQGKSHEKLLVNRKDEVGTLSRALDHMVGTLEEKEESLMTLNAQLTRANNDLEHFAHLASHDLREPARRIGNYADLLQKEANTLSPEGRNLAARLRSASALLLEQISDLRVLTQVGQGRLLRADIDLTDLVKAVLAPHSEKLQGRGIQVRIGELPQMRVYENLVRVLYARLIENAFQHTSATTFDLSFTVSRGDDGESILGVRNTGSEISEENLTAVLRPFTKGAQSTGPGVGLSICQRIVERHRGRIWVESESGCVHVKFTLGSDNHD